MDDAHCVIAVISSEVAKFEMPQIKRRYNVFLICPAALPLLWPGLLLPNCGFGRNDGAKIQTIIGLAK